MKQFTKPLAIGLFFIAMNLGISSSSDYSPPYHRLRTWAELHAQASAHTRVLTYSKKKTVAKSILKSYKVEELPSMPGFAVQLGAFTSQRNAENLIYALRQKGVQNLFYRKVVVQSKTYHKVVIGPFRDRKNAVKRWSAVSKRHGLKEGYVTVI